MFVQSSGAPTPIFPLEVKETSLLKPSLLCLLWRRGPHGFPCGPDLISVLRGKWPGPSGCGLAPGGCLVASESEVPAPSVQMGDVDRRASGCLAWPPHGICWELAGWPGVLYPWTRTLW